MTATFQATGDQPATTPLTRLWRRQLSHYPNNTVRYSSLAIVVATTVILYYQQYLSGGVATQILRDVHMSFLFYVNISVFASVAGAVASLVAGLSDRYGRANIVTAGLGLTSLLVLFAVPQVHSEYPFAILVCIIGFVEGIILVATPALIRDFSPQLGRASAMGFWTLGPVIGSLMVSAIVTPTFKHARATNAFGWFWEYRLCGIISLVIFAIAVFFLRELAPEIRDQLMVSEKDRALIEARAKGIDMADIEAGLRRPFRQMLHVDIIGSAFAISVFLIIYYIAVGFFPIFFQTVYGYTASQANSIGNYFWAVDAAALIIIGYLSDKLRVRKPFMVVGGVLAVVFTLIFSLHATSSGTTKDYASSHAFMIGILIAVSVSLGIAYAPWMASYTETAERHNPALTATGLAIWGMIIRVVIAVAVVIAPHIVNTVTPLVEKGPILQGYLADPTPIQTAAGTTTVGGVATAVAGNGALVGQVSADGAQYKAQLATAAAIDPATLAALTANPSDSAAIGTAVGDISSKLGVTPAVAVTDLVALSKVPPSVLTLLGTTAPKALGAANFAALTSLGTPAANPELTKAINYLSANGTQVAKASKDSPGQWRNYFWVAIGGEIVFIPLVLLMAGYWDPRKAKKAEQEHAAVVAAEMAKLQDA